MTSGNWTGDRGKLIVLSAPSGSGKTTIAKEVIRLNPGLRFSVSATTRPKRDGEREGEDYFFLTNEEFRRRIDADKFVEWEEIFGNHYGTLKRELDAAIREARNLLFDVDVKGGLSIQRAYPGALMVFIRTPNMAVLKERLLRRKSETEEMVQTRLRRVPMELRMGKEYKHQIINDDLQKAVLEVQTIIQGFLQS